MGAIYRLGNCFHYGVSIKPNLEKAVAFYEAIDKKGFKEASTSLAEVHFILGSRYFEGEEVAQNYERALVHFKKSESFGNVQAIKILGEVQYLLGKRIEETHGINDTSHNRGIEFYKEAAIVYGNREAKRALGNIYYKLAKSLPIEKGLSLYIQAASYDNAQARALLVNLDFENEMYKDASIGHRYLYSVGTAFENHWIELAKTDALFQYLLGLYYFQNSNMKEAFTFFLRSAEQAYRHAQFRVGLSYAKGKGTDQNDEKAANFFLKAADGGIIPAQYRMGKYFSDGIWVKRSEANAAKYFRLAADGNYVKAYTQLGLCCLKGKGMESDHIQAVQNFQKGSRSWARPWTILSRSGV